MIRSLILLAAIALAAGPAHAQASGTERGNTMQVHIPENAQQT